VTARRLGQEHDQRRTAADHQRDAAVPHHHDRGSDRVPPHDRRALVTQREIGLDADTYPGALRSALRADPDVILIGEVRDEETAITALRAAETGHLVVCTMHTTGASETIQRFAELFTERTPTLARQMLSSTLVGIVSQRLVRAPAAA